MSLHSILIELAKHLKQERLCVQSERVQLQNLNEEVKGTAEDLCHLSWVCQQQRAALNSLILCRQGVTPASCCQLTNQIEKANFMDSYKLLSYHDSKYGEFLEELRKKPSLLANCLVHCESLSVENMQKNCQVIFSSLYGNCLMAEDEVYVLELLKCLIQLQLAVSVNPRRLIQRGTCAFSTVFKLLHNCLFSVKLFLTAALYKPIMFLLMEDEWFYDIYPDRAMVRFPPNEKLRRFGKEGTPEHEAKLKEYRVWTVNKLAQLTEHFISSIKNNMYCFPQSLYWIVSQVYQLACSGGQVDANEARLLCADLVFAFFVCPAICDPEPYGLTSDVPVSYIARHNLMQVAQIIQVLAISNWDEIDQKLQDLYGKFEKGCMSSLLDSILEDCVSETPPSSQSQIQVPCRTAVLLTSTELYNLITLLKDVLAQLGDDNNIKPLLEELLHMLPAQCLEVLAPNISTTDSVDSTPNESPPGTPSTKRKGKKKSVPLLVQTEGDHKEDDSKDLIEDQALDDVLVITLEPNIDCPGMLSEEKVLENERGRRKVTYEGLPSYDESGNEIQEKRTRFSLSHDQESIGNTSDYLEAISEAASSHSVTSDRDENDLSENDNMSDMTSANVSGRGTPNVSGRDTPQSGTSAAAGSSSGENTQQQVPDLHLVPVTVEKTNREDVTERFGKFEWEFNDVRSVVSDSWSTDVLASDSEPPDRDQVDRLEEVAEESLLDLLHPHEGVSETASESAWSTDVLASDTSERPSERLLELETDDVMSVSSKGPDDRATDDVEERPEDIFGAIGGVPQSPPPPALYISEEQQSISSSPGDRMNFSLDSSFSRSPPAEVPRARRHDRFLYNDQRSPTSRTQYIDPFSTNPVRIRSTPNADYTGHAFRRLIKDNNERKANASQRETVSDMVSVYKKIEENKHNYTSNMRVSDSLQHAEGRVVSVLQELEDPSLPQQTINSIKMSDKGEYKYEAVASSFMSEKTERLATGATEHVISRSSYPRSEEVNSVNFNNGDLMIEIDTAIRLRNGTSLEDSNRSSDGINLNNSGASRDLFQQQSLNINANRLSAAVEFFDPLMREDEYLDQEKKQKDSNIQSSEASGGTSELSHAVNHVTEQIENVSLNTTNMAGNTASAVSTSSTESVSKSRSSTESSDTSLQLDPRGGAILKSASFDSAKSDEAGDSDAAGSKKSGFFHTFKNRFTKKGTKKKGMKDEPLSPSTVQPRIGTQGSPLIDKHNSLPVVVSENVSKELKALTDRSQSVEMQETSDDILEKYRKSSGQIAGQLNQADGESTDETTPTKDSHSTVGKEVTRDETDDNSPPYYDPANLEQCKAFSDAKRKLRLVLSMNDLRSLPVLANFSSRHFKLMSSALRDSKKENELVAFLKLQLAEAIGLQDRDLIAQLHEVIRCLYQFDNDGIKKIINSLKEDYRNRTAYISYLVRCKQGLLSSKAYLQRLHKRVSRDKEDVNHCLISVCVRMFLEKQNRALQYLVRSFVSFKSPDEKTDFVEKFLVQLWAAMEVDGIWQASSEAQFEAAKLLVERFAMSHIYTKAMFPNGDMDISRDTILNEHIKRLSKTITPGHRLLRIAGMYRCECPWPSAQAEIYKINVYKTPRDKLACVLCCSTTIMNILSMANESSVPAADDFMPVLIFVLIKANPPSLLSTVQYVNSFYEKRMTGEEMYWWAQFSSAIEFIKTMD